MSTPSNTGTIFNVPEPQGAEFETTAAEAQAHARSPVVAREIEANADQAQGAAEQAASVAKTLGSDLTGEPRTAVDQFRHEASDTTNTAVAEGKHDVDAAKATGAGYVEQAKALASSAISTAQAYLPTAAGGKPADTTTTGTNTTGTGLVSSIQSSVSSAIGVTSEYLASAKQTAQPHIENAKGVTSEYLASAKQTAQPHIENAKGVTSEYLASAKQTAQPHIENAKGVAQNALGTAGTQGKDLPPASSTGIPATSAPLESGPHTIATPYPSTTTTTGTNIGANEGARAVN